MSDKIKIIPCSGMGKVYGLLARESALKATEELCRDTTEILCLASLVSGDNQDAQPLKNSACITIDGCPAMCAKTTVELSGGQIIKSLKVLDKFRQKRGITPGTATALTQDGWTVAEEMAQDISQAVKEALPQQIAPQTNQPEDALMPAPTAPKTAGTDKPRRPVGIISCSGEDCLGGTISRLATRKILEELKEEAVTICLPLYLAGGEEERAFAQDYPTITVDGCNRCCAKKATEKYSGQVSIALNISDTIKEETARSAPLSTGQTTPEYQLMIDQVAQTIHQALDQI